MPHRRKKSADSKGGGKLRIGDHWNAISIIALSQSNPLKAVAEFVENSIDAQAKHITITRGKEGGEQYLRIVDDGGGVPRDGDGLPDFRYVATHICDSIKRRLSAEDARNVQGEFGIGLLSFWTVGKQLTMLSTAANGKTYQMQMVRGKPDYTVEPRRVLFSKGGTSLTVKPLLSGIRQFSGEKLQWYLASELRDRIRKSGVKIDIIDRQARSQHKVEPRKFHGRLLQRLPEPSTPLGAVYVEIYLADPKSESQVALYRSGTRVLPSITEVDEFQVVPWSSGYLLGIIDAPFLSLTPGSRSGIIQDEAFGMFRDALKPLEDTLSEIVARQVQAEEEKASQNTLRSIQKAFREASLILPAEEYDWIRVRGQKAEKEGGDRQGARTPPGIPLKHSGTEEEATDSAEAEPQKKFFEYAGPLFSVRISPASTLLPVQQKRSFRAIARDRSRRQVEDNLAFSWEVSEGSGVLDNQDREIVTFVAPSEPGLTKLSLSATQGEIVCTAESLITVTDSLIPSRNLPGDQRGLPGYTFRKAPGELWRSRYDEGNNLIIINNGHRDFVYCSKNKSLKLRYLCRLFAKEMVYRNFPGYPPEQLLERLIELSLYTEEHLR